MSLQHNSGKGFWVPLRVRIVWLWGDLLLGLDFNQGYLANCGDTFGCARAGGRSVLLESRG
jgi:hypothetical protein